MKKNLITMALFAALSLFATGCQKEESINSTNESVELCDAKTIHYSIDGTDYIIIVQNEAEYDEILSSLLTMAKNGSVVKIYTASNSNNSAKETVTYTTSSSTQAQIWAKDMIDAGYSVVIQYNKEQNLYICTATR